MNALRAFAVALAAALTAGCASLEAPLSRHLDAEAAPERECAQWFRRLDEEVAQDGAGDAQEARVPGFPYLRATRLLAALRPLAAANEQALQALADRMQLADLEARRYEMLNLAPGRLADVREAFVRTRDCGRRLRALDFALPGARAEFLRRAEVPDNYSAPLRFLGLYALTRFAFAAGIRRYEEETRTAFGGEPSMPAGAVLVRAAPPAPAQPLARARAALILERAAQNPLGIPEPEEAELAELLAAHAPSIEIPVRADYDRFGALRWRRGAGAPEVDTGQLAVYAHPAWTLYRGRVLLQLVYTIWFPERPPQSGDDILAGKLDGLTWRVTLAPDGAPLVYDSIHPCGCYHQFFPTARAHALAGPGGVDEWMFAPQALPAAADGERPVLRLASGTHYIERVSLTHGSDSLARYELRPYGELRSLQRAGPGRASVFGANGLVAGSERPERFAFWPAGIASAGAMRQWGRQATAFVGRRHFDDADLFERRFLFDLD